MDVDENGNIVQRVRKTTDHILHVTQLPNWDSVVPDAALSALDQRILKQDAQIRALTDLANAIDSNKVDDLVYDDINETLQLSAKGIGVGTKVSVRDMLDDGIPVVDLNSGSGTENPDTEGNDDCDCKHNCNCESDVAYHHYFHKANC